MVDKCKVEAQTQALKEKEAKFKAIMRLKDLSVIDKKEKAKTMKVALKLAGDDIDLAEVFKDLPQKKKEEDWGFDLGC